VVSFFRRRVAVFVTVATMAAELVVVDSGPMMMMIGGMHSVVFVKISSDVDGFDLVVYIEVVAAAAWT
jgi:hypothetical protein